MNFSTNVEFIRVQAPVAAGQATTTTTRVDTQGYEGCTFIFGIGTIAGAGTVVCTVRQDTVTGMGSAAALSGASVAYAAADASKLCAIDIYKPLERYLDAQIVTAVGNGVIDLVIAVLYKGEKSPITQSTTVQEVVTLASPSEA